MLAAANITLKTKLPEAQRSCEQELFSNYTGGNAARTLAVLSLGFSLPFWVRNDARSIFGFGIY